MHKLNIIAKYYIYILKECQQTFRSLLDLQCKINKINNYKESVTSKFAKSLYESPLK